jgi:hypothetical protein
LSIFYFSAQKKKRPATETFRGGAAISYLPAKLAN